VTDMLVVFEPVLAPALVVMGVLVLLSLVLAVVLLSLLGTGVTPVDHLPCLGRGREML
jgi:hypothetical protein